LPTSISIGFSQLTDPENAIIQACMKVKNQLNTDETELIIIFASSHYIVPEIQTVITRILKPKHLVGSSTGGIILSDSVENFSIAIICINSEEMRYGISAKSKFNVNNIISI
jgi:hypothetical protein